jgi:hypothetical protein
VAGWQYDEKSRRYRSQETGRYLSNAQMLKARDGFTDAMKGRAADLATRRAEGDLSANAWEREMRSLIKNAHVDMAALGRGGRRQMAPADWGRVGAAIREQYSYLGRFADDTANLSEAQVRARAGLYVSSSQVAYERGRAAAWDVTLPQHPGDHSTACGSNCRCSWLLEEAEGGAVRATWQVNGAAESCPDCVENGRRWNPLIVQAASGALANLGV